MNLDDEVDLYCKNHEKRPGPAVVAEFKVLCQRTGLSPLTRQIYLVPRGAKLSAQTSIDGFRAIAARQSNYLGQAGPFYCTSADGTWTDIPPDGPPYAAKVGILVAGAPQPTWAVAKYRDYNAGGPMWTKFASTMTAKCAEALAIRKAFPVACAGLYTAEEMAQAGGKGAGQKATYNREVVPGPAERVEESIQPGERVDYEATLRDSKDWAQLQAAVKLVRENGAITAEEKLRLSKVYYEVKDLIEGNPGGGK